MSELILLAIFFITLSFSIMLSYEFYCHFLKDKKKFTFSTILLFLIFGLGLISVIFIFILFIVYFMQITKLLGG